MLFHQSIYGDQRIKSELVHSQVPKDLPSSATRWVDNGISFYFIVITVLSKAFLENPKAALAEGNLTAI